MTSGRVSLLSVFSIQRKKGELTALHKLALQSLQRERERKDGSKSVREEKRKSRRPRSFFPLFLLRSPFVGGTEHSAPTDFVVRRIWRRRSTEREQERKDLRPSVRRSSSCCVHTSTTTTTILSLSASCQCCEVFTFPRLSNRQLDERSWNDDGMKGGSM